MAGYIGNKSSVVSSGAERKFKFTITETTTTLSNIVYTPTLVHVFHNGVRLVDGTDYTATNGTSITLNNAAENGDEVVVISYASFQTSDTVSAIAGGTFEGNVTVNADLAVSGNTDINGGLTVGTAVYPTSGPLSNRNKIINGAMVIDQRNAGASVTITNTGANTYTLDRWFAYGNNASKFSVEQNAGSVSPPVGFSNYLGTTSLATTVVAAGDQYVLGQSIEGFNVADLAWGTSSAKQVTLSFKVYSSLTGSFGGALRNSAADRSYPFLYTISTPNTWTEVSVTIPGDTSGTWLTNNGVGVNIFFSLGVGSTYLGAAGAWSGSAFTSAIGETAVVGTNGATFYITGVQLEAGDTATPFEHRSYGQELALCQRYYQKYTEPPLRGVASSASTAGRCAMILPTTMRATPTAALSGTLSMFDGTTVDTSTVIGVAYLTLNSIELDLATAGTLTINRPVCVYTGGGGGSISITAEL